MTEDLHTYAGLYALDAVDGALLTEFEHHLSVCSSCTQEVREFRATAGRLGATQASLPSPALRSSVLAAITNVRQEAPFVAATHRHRNRWITPLAVAAALVLTFGVLRTITSPTAPLTAESVINAADVRQITLTAPAGIETKAFVSVKENRIALTADGMPPAPAGRSYQLWLLGPAGFESAGFMDPPPGGKHAAVLLKGTLSGHQRMMITDEPAGGSIAPSGPTLVEGQF